MSINPLELSSTPTIEITPEQQTLFSLQEMTVITTRSMGKIKEDIKSAAEILKDALMNNPVYNGKDSELKEKKKELLTVQANVEQAPDIIAVKTRLKELRGELKEKKESVSDYVLELNRIGGITEIQVDDVMYEIVKSAKLVKQHSI